MTLTKIATAVLVSGAIAVAFNPSAFAATPGGCTEPKIGTDAVPIHSPPLANVVMGTGRLQFYSAPYQHCAMDGVFVIPKDTLVAYARTDDGWSQVMYINPRTGEDTSGWVRSARLKITGTMGPKQ